MKLISLAVICFAQTCLSGSIPRPRSNQLRFTDPEIESWQSEYKQRPGMNYQTIDRMASTLKNFRPNATEVEVVGGAIDLLNLVVNVNVKGDHKVDLKQVFNESSSEEVTDDDPNENVSDSDYLSAHELKKLRIELANYLNQTQFNFVMSIFRRFRQGATSQEVESAKTDLFKFAVRNALKLPNDSNSNSNLV